MTEREEEAEVERLERRGQRRADLRGLVLDVRIEQRLADDREREPHHLLAYVEHLARPPPLVSRRRMRGHRRAIRGCALAVERRLSEATLSEVELAFAREEPVAEQHLRALEASPFVKVAVVGDEDLAYEVGVVEQVERLRA